MLSKEHKLQVWNMIALRQLFNICIALSSMSWKQSPHRWLRVRQPQHNTLSWESVICNKPPRWTWWWICDYRDERGDESSHPFRGQHKSALENIWSIPGKDPCMMFTSLPWKMYMILSWGQVELESVTLLLELKGCIFNNHQGFGKV